jgi:endonuclease/exonuclease/phosphatase family metal-dependent hydrolase
MIQEKAASFNGTPVVVTGDFNVDQGSDCYQTMVSANMGDARLLAEETDDACTYHDFKPEEGGYIIDFIFIDKATIKANKFDVVDKLIDGQFYSDHYAIYSDIELI